ncbi:winged helix DNA-binding protein [Novosphingobium huizhouense]|uniref:winged helix DNA-binding protein n=1 Tax=Novosphingobium huizhouense TaxID=2866625 RepID=UPI001CD8DB98|nr:winged helix DNA-binding protein [Novosphingobium huizhouense]
MGDSAAPFDHSFAAGSGPERRAGAPAVSIFADRGYLRAEMAEDAAAAGLRVAQTGPLERLLADAPGGGGGTGAVASAELVLVDCPMAEGAQLAALSKLDLDAARTGAALVVSTSMGSLDDVFGCLDQSDAQILVSPSRAERVIALGQVLARAGARVRELSEEDRLSLLRLTDQVTQIAQKLEALSSGQHVLSPSSTVFRFDAAGDLGEGGAERLGDRLVKPPRPPMPDPRLVRRIIRHRQARARFLPADLFADPAWDMLLDLTAAREEHTRVSVTSLCIASGVPPTTALRWIGQMTEAGLLQRLEDETDRRRAFITLTEKAADAIARYFAEVLSPASAAAAVV